MANSRLLLSSLFLSLAIHALFGQKALAEQPERGSERPNIIVLFSDDAGYSDFGFQPTVREEMRSVTPRIDSIAAAGLRCSSAYMSGCVCSPSRAGLMTGRYQARFGFDNNLPPNTKNGLPLSETFLAKRLQKLGYATSLIGKWHLGYPDKFHPNERGFDWFYGCLQGSRSYFAMRSPTPHRVILENRNPTDEVGYVTDRFGDAAVKFIRKERDQPFFLFVSFTAPHGPLQAKPEDLKSVSHIEDKKRKTYAAMIKSLDDNVGKILDAIKETGIEDNTFVLFTNDNGGQTRTGAVNLPLRARKGTLYEGGVRVPWAMKWPGKITPKTTTETPVISLDLLPTFVEMAGGTVAEEWNTDGTSLLPLFKGEAKGGKLNDRTLFWRKAGNRGAIAARKGPWKLVYNRDMSGALPELYDLKQDLKESNDVSESNSEILKAMLSEIRDWEAPMVEPLWGQKGRKRRNRQGKKTGE